MRFQNTNRRGQVAARSGRPLANGRSLRYESLEGRQMLSVTLESLHDIQVPGGRSVLVPLTGVDSAGGPITYTYSADTGVTLELVSPTSKSLKFEIEGTDGAGAAFTGTIIIHLFEDLAPGTSARFEQLAASGYFDDKPITRINDGFVLQGGDEQGASSGTILKDEFVESLTFVSPGLFATANHGRDTGDTQFFVTAVNKAGTNTPVTLADMPQTLTYRYTIFGQLVAGFDIFAKAMSTDVEYSAALNETSSPVNDMTIKSATVITDTQNAVLRVTAPDASVGSSYTVTVTATNAAQETTQRTFEAAAITDTDTDPPFLGAVDNQTTTAGTPVAFTLTATDATGVGKVFKVADATTFAANANVTVSINQATGVVTLTPVAGFTGTISLKAGVKSTAGADTLTNYDTEVFTLTVTGDGTTTGPAAPTGLAVAASSTTGAFDGNGYVSTATPLLTVNAVTGSTVKFYMGTTEVATGVETATGSGVFRATIPAGKLAVGANAITAKTTTTAGTSVASTALSVIFAPNYTSGVYVVPGAAGVTQQLTAQWLVRRAAFSNEIGYFVADAADGTVAGVAPSAANYAQTALNSSTRQVLFSKGQTAGQTATISAAGGKFIVFYMIQNNTTANFLAKNAANVAKGNNNGNAPLAFFSVAAANPDDMKHAQVIADAATGSAQYNWEDLLSLGDSDFNDVAMRVSLTAAANMPINSTVHAPGAGTGNVKLNGTLVGGAQTLGDVGVFFVDGPNGAIGSLTPGATGYAAAALTSANSRVLFAGGGTTTSSSVTVPAGKYLAFYTLSSGTTANFLTANSTNSATGSAVAMFSFDAANNGSTNHFSWIADESETVDPAKIRLHVAERTFGSSAADIFALDLAFANV